MGRIIQSIDISQIFEPVGKTGRISLDLKTGWMVCIIFCMSNGFL
jgi:hypothetical protein